MHSQGPEEALIRRHFKRRTARFLDIGANDGKTLSNTFACMERGWSGVMVEPSPKAFVRLQATCEPYSDRVEVFNVAIGTEQGTATLYESGEHLGTGDVALLSSLSEDETKRWTGDTFEGVEVRVATFAMLTSLFPPPFNLISIDAEGMDLEILRQIDLTACGCEALIIEHEHSDGEAIKEYVRGHGLKLHTRTHQNFIFFR